MIVGMDFGTTNSGMAVYNGRSIDILPLDPANKNPRVARTALYITNEQETYIGRNALDIYFEQNIGRSVKTKKVWVGEIEIRGADMYYVTDAYIYVDVMSPGRLFLSIKTGLRDAGYPGSVIGQYFYPLEELIGLFMTITKMRAEKHVGQDLNQIVLGRPVRFATDPEMDRLAQARLMQAAFHAGYEKVYFQKEPIAAAYSYETTIDEEQNVMVFDFGGGTLDLTVMRLGNPKTRKVLATGGIPVAGDVFDQRIVRNKLPPHFGEGSFYGPRSKKLRVPPWIFDTFSNWQTIMELQSQQNKLMLQDIRQTAQKKHQIEMLEALVSGNYGQRMFDVVEASKRQLSEKRGAQIMVEGPGFKVIEFITRSEFEQYISQEIIAIDAHIDETLAASGLKASEIDAVIRTGGSSQIPVFDEMLQRKIGADKVRRIDTFSSVTAGLGVIGHRIEAGEIEGEFFTPDDLKPIPHERDLKPNVKPINLDLLQRRILVAEGGLDDADFEVEKALVMLGAEHDITAVSLTAQQLENGDPISLDAFGLPSTPQRSIVADLDDQLLVITSHYRFLLVTPRQLLEWQSVDVHMAEVYQMGQRETFCTVSDWRRLKASPKMLIVTSLGLARPYPMRIMQENIETPVPLKFDNNLFGVPIFVHGAESKQTLLAVAESGRGVRYPVSKLRTSGTQIFNCGKDDRLSGAILCQRQDELVLLTEDGYGRITRAEWVEAPAKDNSKGKSLVSRRSRVIGLFKERAMVVTDQRLLSLDDTAVSPENSTKTERLLKLEKDESIQALIV